jgi:HK97 family phage major capsid protein
MTIKDLQSRNRDINDRLGELDTVVNQRELTAAELAEEAQLKREFAKNQREIAMLNQEEQTRQNEANVQRDENAELREFVKNAKPGSKFEFAFNKRDAMSTTVPTPHVQGVTVKDIIKTDRPDADIFAAAGVGITTGVTGNKIQWAYAGGVEAVFANELAQTTERTVDISSQTPVQQRLTVRVRVSQQSLENASFDLRGLFVQAVSDAIRQKVNWAAVSTTKATSVFYGGFAQDTEKGTFGSSGYTPGKQVGTYTTLSKEVFAEMIGKLAARNIKLDKAVFVLGAEDYWKAKVTPMDEGSGIMLLGNDGRILGIPVVANNAINRATEKGAVAGHNIGLGDFSALPVMQHGNIRLSIDGVSAFAADTDEVIITINADFSMTVLKGLADAFVVYSKQA